MLTAFIDDGYTEDRILPEIAGISPAVRFEFRPMTAAEFSDYIQANGKQTVTEGKAEAARRLHAKISRWDIKNAKGETVPIAPENLLRLKQPVFSGLWDIVTCQGAGIVPGTDVKN